MFLQQNFQEILYISQVILPNFFRLSLNNFVLLLILQYIMLKNIYAHKIG